MIINLSDIHKLHAKRGELMKALDDLTILLKNRTGPYKEIRGMNKKIPAIKKELKQLEKVLAHSSK